MTHRAYTPAMKRLACVFFTLFALALRAAEPSAEDLDRRREALRDLLDEHWEYTMRVNPEWASVLGDRRFNDQVTDVSEAAERARLADAKRFLKRFEAIGTT